MKTVIAAVLALCAALSGGLAVAQPDGVLRLASGSELHELVVDVRSAEEFATGYAPGAINIPHTEIGAQIAKHALALDQPIVLYCRSGRRADMAKKVLEEMGYTRVVNVGGYEDMLKRH